MSKFPLEVELSWREAALGAWVGIQRRIRRTSQGVTDTFADNDGPDLWTRDINGALAELAAAKALNVYWDATIEPNGRDVGSLQIRYTPHDDGCLVVRRRDRDDAIFVLVTGGALDYRRRSGPTFVVRGWLRGGDAKRAEWARDPGGLNPAWFAPQAALELELEDIS